MPTARELLEQADALMRRNRAASAVEVSRRESPPDTETRARAPVAANAVVSPRTIQREPIQPAAMASASAPSAPLSSLKPPQSGEHDVPLLTEAVPEASAASFDTLDLPTSRESIDDVPLLTDAVEEIDVPIVDDIAGGEPSIWEMTARGESSVLGPAPDTLVVVPPPDLPPPGRDPLGLDQPPRGFVPSDTASAAAAETARRATMLPPIPDALWVERAPSHIGSDAADTATRTDEVAPPIADALAPPVVAEVSPDDGAAVERDQPRDLPAEERFNNDRIREVAEEISMQVLQRIDIFADTSLRAQLVERLRPAVDRASAELVAHINEHIGELLRAFVAEAIEREIENWRDRENESKQ